MAYNNESYNIKQTSNPLRLKLIGFRSESSILLHFLCNLLHLIHFGLKVLLFFKLLNWQKAAFSTTYIKFPSTAIFQVLSRSKYGSKRAAFITRQWHILMKPSFVCLMAPGLHLSLEMWRTDTPRSPCQLWFGDEGDGSRGQSRFDLTWCGALFMLGSSCENMADWHGQSE